MSLRIVIRLVVLVASIGIGIAGMRMIKSDNWSGLLLGFSCMAVAVSGAVVSVFKMPVFGNAYPDSGFGVLSERQGISSGAVLVFFFGTLLVFLALKGVYSGAMPALGSGPDIVFAQAPFRYLLSFVVWSGGGACLIWLSWKVARSRKTKGNRAAGDA
jgi:hypothetical protein